MKRITFMLLMLICVTALNAQMAPTGNLTVFSEDGSKFYLILNGERYNSEPETNVRIEELPNPYYSCKIIFENQAIPVIEKKNLMLTDVDGIMQDVTYRIKTDKKGKRSLSFYSNIPVEQNMPRPTNCAVYRYGAPNQAVVASNGTVYTQQVTVQQTTTTNQAGVNMNMGGMGVSITVPVDEVTTTTTTTTTTTDGYGYSNNGNYSNNNNYDSGPGRNNHNNNNGNNGQYGGCRNAMAPGDFEAAKQTITGSSFDDTRLSTAKSILASNCVNTTQVQALVKLMTFEENKLALAKFAYPYCVDKNNYFKVVNSFTFDSSKTELNEFISSQR